MIQKNSTSKKASKPMLLLQSGKKSFYNGLFFKTTATIFSFCLLVSLFALAFFVIQGRQIVHVENPEEVTLVAEVYDARQFPVGIDVERKEIVENPAVETYFDEHIAMKSSPTAMHTSWFSRTLGKLALMNWYQNLASLSSRVLVIQSGERKEQVADHFAKILGWSLDEKKNFLAGIENAEPELVDGKFFPGTYTTAKEAAPEDVIPLITDRFQSEVLSRYGDDVEAAVPLSDALTIASLLEREAYDFEDMRLIAGVIWNRLFIDMNLQIDATLQYAKGSKPNQPWWPRVIPNDKYIASVYNTYKNSGLPPAPIANPSLDSILAALNPRKTDCMFYFHDKRAGFHCSKTYAEHVASLKQYYGQGK